MTQNTSDWEKEVAKYLRAMETEIGAWEQVYVDANTAVGGALGNSKTKTDELTEASKNLRDKLIGPNGDGGVVAALKSVYDKIIELNPEYSNQKTIIGELVGEYDKLIGKLTQISSLEGTNITTPGLEKNYGYEIIDLATGVAIE
jgi:hypothetical protein